MRKTKIVCTLGPASSGIREISELARAGMELDPARHQAFAPEPSPDPTKGA